MNIIECYNNLTSKNQIISKIVGCTVLATVCGYGGTFLFTNLNPRLSASYFGSVALISQVVYQVLENLKSSTENPANKYAIAVVQLLQIPVFFYLSHGPIGPFIHGAIKLEMIVATAHFVAIPAFFHLAIRAWNDPSSANVAAAVGVMLPLANGLLRFTSVYPAV